MRQRKLRLVSVAAIALTIGITGCGDAPGAKQPQDGLTVNVAMRRDFTFNPDKITAKSGTTVLFRFYNSSSVVHDAYIGDQAAQDAREQAMVRRGLGHGGMDDANGVEVAPGASKALSYHFSHPGMLLLGCHELGHFAAGMKATITVT